MESAFGLILTIWALPARWFFRKRLIGIGPLPLINNIFHKKAMEQFGYNCETFVYNPYYITRQFDCVEDWSETWRPLRRLGLMHFTLKYLFRYECLYLYFNGHILGISTRWLWRIEPWLLKLAGVKTVILAYGADVQDMRRSPNLLFRHAMNIDYPAHFRSHHRIAEMIDLWSRWGNHIIGGCEWVDYMTHWDTLMLAHFSIDPDQIRRQVRGELDDYDAKRQANDNRPLRIVHAINHRAIKGTTILRKAVRELQEEGCRIELKEFFRMDHETVLREMAAADIIADQFIVGWYAMFALEAFCMAKPVLCYLREDLLRLYEFDGLIEHGEIPIVNTSAREVKEVLRNLHDDRAQLREIGESGLAFVQKHHSVKVVGKVFDRINRSLGLEPQGNIDGD